jgi:hypothetical protein
MKEVDTLGLALHFDGTGYPQWKVLMEAYLQAKDLDVWRVTGEGMKNGTKKEKQFDVIAKSIILSSLDAGVHFVSLRNSIALSNLQMKMPNLCTHA